jgi:hypothetical protein
VGVQVLDPCLAFFVALVARDRRDVDDLAHRDGFFDVMIRLLETEGERDGLLPLEDVDAQRMGITKTQRVVVRAVFKAFWTCIDEFCDSSRICAASL